jgi:hypothetical protein
MKLLRFLKKAVDDDSGAVTVDWVVLAAATVVLGTAVANTIKPGVSNRANAISSGIISATTF